MRFKGFYKFCISLFLFSNFAMAGVASGEINWTERSLQYLNQFQLVQWRSSLLFGSETAQLFVAQKNEGPADFHKWRWLRISENHGIQILDDSLANALAPNGLNWNAVDENSMVGIVDNSKKLILCDFKANQCKVSDSSVLDADYSINMTDEFLRVSKDSATLISIGKNWMNETNSKGLTLYKLSVSLPSLKLISREKIELPNTADNILSYIQGVDEKGNVFIFQTGDPSPSNNNPFFTILKVTPDGQILDVTPKIELNVNQNFRVGYQYKAQGNIYVSIFDSNQTKRPARTSLILINPVRSQMIKIDANPGGWLEVDTDSPFYPNFVSIADAAPTGVCKEYWIDPDGFSLHSTATRVKIRGFSNNPSCSHSDLWGSSGIRAANDYLIFGFQILKPDGTISWIDVPPTIKDYCAKTYVNKGVPSLKYNLKHSLLYGGVSGFSEYLSNNQSDDNGNKGIFTSLDLDGNIKSQYRLSYPKSDDFYTKATPGVPMDYYMVGNQVLVFVETDRGNNIGSLFEFNL